MEWWETYSSEVILGGSGTIGTLVIGALKAFANRIRKMENKISELEKRLEINTALDRERAKKN